MMAPHGLGCGSPARRGRVETSVDRTVRGEKSTERVCGQRTAVHTLTVGESRPRPQAHVVESARAGDRLSAVRGQAVGPAGFRGTSSPRPRLLQHERHIDLLLLSAAHQGDLDRFVHRLRADEGTQGDGIVHLGAGHLDDVVAVLESGLVRGRAALDRLHLGAASRDASAVDVAVGESDAEEGMQSLAVGDELIGDHHRLVGGDGEADADRPRLFALAGLAQRRRGRVDSDEPTVAVDERTGGVARVDGGIGVAGTRARQRLGRAGWVRMPFVIGSAFSDEAASSPMFSVDTGRSSAETMPVVTESARPSGLPRAMTGSPTSSFFESPTSSGSTPSGTCSSSMMAMSVEGSRPTISASVVSPFFMVTAISPPGVSAGATTWLFVITCPWSS